MAWLDTFKTPFAKKQMLSVIFIDETGQVHQTIKPYSDNTFRIRTQKGEETYIIDPNCIFYDPRKHMPTSFYYTGNPLPLRLKHTKNYGKDNTKTVDAKTLTKVIDDKVVSDLFRPSEETINIKLVFWMIVIEMMMVAWLVYGSFTV